MTSINTANYLNHDKMKNASMKQWAESGKERFVFKFMLAPNKNDPINQLQRAEQDIVFRLIIEHIQLNKHLNRIGVKNDAKCPLCSCPKESIAHHLYKRPALNDFRTKFTKHTLWG